MVSDETEEIKERKGVEEMDRPIGAEETVELSLNSVVELTNPKTIKLKGQIAQ